MEFKCSYCNKFYASYQSRCNHIRNYHKNFSSNLTQIHSIVPQISSILTCRFCEKILSRKDNLVRHEKKCKEKVKEEIEISELKEKIEKEKAEMKAEIENLKNLIKKSSLKGNKTINTNNGTIDNSVDNSQKIIINNYGSDNLSYLTDEFMKSLFKNLKFEEDYQIPILKLIETIKLNNSHKENNNNQH